MPAEIAETTLLKFSYPLTFFFLLACTGEVPESDSAGSWNPCGGTGDFEVSVGTVQPIRGHYVTRWFGVPEEEIKVRPPQILGDTRDALRVSTPSRFSTALPVNRGKVQFRTAIRRLPSPKSSFPAFENQKIHCEIFVREGDFLSSVAMLELPPPRSVMDQAWHPLELSLSANQAKSLEMVTRWQNPALAAQAGPSVEWANPRIFPIAPKPKPDVVLITVDTLRDDAVEFMPKIQKSFENGEWWTNAISPSSWTLPSYASLFTGLEVAEHGVGRGPFPEVPGKPSLREFYGLKQDLPTLAERFREAGYATCMIHQNPFLEPWTGLDRGFERYARVQEAPQTAVQQARNWWSQNPERPRFLVLHLIAPHLPYTPVDSESNPLDELAWKDFFSLDHTPEERKKFFQLSESKRKILVRQYQNGVSAMDAQLEDFLKLLQNESKLVLAFHADHGEELWDNGSFEHGHSFDDSVIRVPLAIWETGMTSRKEHSGFVAAHWLGATLLKRSGILEDWSPDLTSKHSFRSQGSLYRSLHGGREFHPASGKDRWLNLEETTSSSGRQASLPPELAAALSALGY